MTDLPLNYTTYKNFLNEDQLAGVRCKSCQTVYLPPRPVCSACHHQEFEWIMLNGQGRLMAFTHIYIGPKAMIAAGYDRTHPYCSGIVQLDDGPCISAQILGLSPDHVNELPIGATVTAEFIKHDGETSDGKVLAFRVKP